MSLSKKEVLNNLDQVKDWIEESQNKKEEKTVGIAIKNKFTGEIIFQSTKTVWKDAVEEANLSEADLRAADLRWADLSEADLRWADLSEANLRWADLRWADLSEANLREADLSEANLRGADLMSAKFYGKGGRKVLKNWQVKDFLLALGFIIED